MNINDSLSGKIIKANTGYLAFLPNPLPPKLNWSINLVNALSRADYILGKLAREGSKLPNPHILIRPFITKEAVLSSKIEGTQTTIGEILAEEVGAHVTCNQNDIQEIRNYIEALDHGLKRLKELPIALRLIKEMHTKLMQGVRGSHATPGEFRYTQNWIGSPGCTLTTAKYVPPMPEHLMECLGEFEKYLHDIRLPTLVHIALCHYQFEAIHPFLDGNGRMGRLLITLLLIERNMLPAPILYLSAFFEATRDEYYRQLYNVSAKGTWEDWIIYFLSGIAVQATDVLSRAERINNLLEEWQVKVLSIFPATHGSINAIINIVKHLAVNPFLTISNIANNFGIAYTTAERITLKLQSLGIITQTNKNKRGKIYCATKILEILEEPLNINQNS